MSGGRSGVLAAVVCFVEDPRPFADPLVVRMFHERGPFPPCASRAPNCQRRSVTLIGPTPRLSARCLWNAVVWRAAKQPNRGSRDP
ncbi:hypothetical protein GQ53DRAFT_746456 [Thozetella sp. PMI_491]|nr:hypothetical protein GQ53DRAFT_746456 [Thozetella sp. PMI_491]